MSVNIEQQIVDIFDRESIPVLENIIRQSTNKLQVIAARFMKNYINVQNQIQQIEIDAIKMQEMRHTAKESNSSLPQKYQQLLNARKQIMTQSWWNQIIANADEFQNELNALLGQQISTVYVATQGRGKNKQVKIYELPQGEFIKPGISSANKVVGRYQISLTQLKQKAKELIPDKDRDIAALSQTYLTALARYEELKAKKYAGFYWLTSKKKYRMIAVSNKGDIGEAFLNAALGKKKIFMGTNIEANLSQFAKLVAKVDSGSGLLFGDFTGDNGIEYAAKSEGASMLGMQQMVTLAQEILSGQVVDVNGLRQKQKQYLQAGTLRNTIKTDVHDELKALLNIIKTNKKS